MPSSQDIVKTKFHLVSFFGPTLYLLSHTLVNMQTISQTIMQVIILKIKYRLSQFKLIQPVVYTHIQPARHSLMIDWLSKTFPTIELSNDPALIALQ